MNAASGDGRGKDLSIAIIGAGFAGIGMAIKLKERGFTDFTIIDGGERVGGTWRDNTYPGCACDIPSHLYSFSFERNPGWSRNYSPQGEILAYLEGCVEKYGLAPHVRLGTWITGATWDDAAAVWHLASESGDRFTARVLIAGTGPLRAPRLPDLPGLDGFPGEVMHSAEWNHDYDFEGKRVAVIGTGASAIQLVPELAKVASSLSVFQRTPPWLLPKIDGEIPDAWKDRFREHPSLSLAYRSLIFGITEALGSGFFAAPSLLDWREKVARRYLEREVKDPALRAKLTPRYRIGCKRVLFTNDYLPAVQRENVALIASGVERVEGNTVVASDGTRSEVDAIVFGTGFRVTDFLSPLRVTGRGGLDLEQAWRGGAEAYYGISISGFPNAFVLVGPNTGLGHSSIIAMIEAQVHFVLQCVERIRDEGLGALDVRSAAQRQFNARVQERLQESVWAQGGCVSWYLDEHGKNVTLWPGYVTEYWLRTRRVRFDHYEEIPLPAATRTPRATARAALAE